MRAHIWGCRGSLAAPGPDTVRTGGNTSCVELRTETGDLIILDAGTGLRALGLHLTAEEPRTNAEGDGIRRLFRNRTFVFGTAYAWVFMGALGCSVTYLAVATHQEVGVSVIVAGYLLAVLQLGGITGRIGWGMLSDRLGRRAPAMVICGILTILVCFSMAFVRGAVPVLLVGALAFLLGLAAMGWNALYLTLVSDQVPVRSAATAIGAGLTISFSGMFIVTPIFGFIADRAGSYEISWLALAGWAVVGTLLGLGIRERRHA